LILLSTASYTLADGKQSNTLLCLGTIKAQDDNQVIHVAPGTVSVSFNNPTALLGVDFLERIKGKLVLDLPNKRAWIEINKAQPITKPKKNAAQS